MKRNKNSVISSRIMIFEPTGRGSHYHYTRSLALSLQEHVDSLRIISSAGDPAAGYLAKLLPMREYSIFHAPGIGSLIRLGHRLIVLKMNYLVLGRYIRRERIKLVHFQVLHNLFLPLVWIYKRLFGLRLVFTPHNIAGHYRRKWLLNVFNRAAFGLLKSTIDHFIAHSAYHRRSLMERGVPAGRITEIAFAPHQPGSVDSSLRESRTILFAGALRRNKGLLDLLDAVEIMDQRLLQEEAQPVTVCIAGQPRDLAIAGRIKNLQARLQRVRIEFKPGFLDDETYAGYLNRAAILVLPYTKDFASLSAVLLDGYRHDNEIIATDVAANGEIIRRDGSGYLVPPQNPPELADCIFDVLRSGRNQQHSRNRQRALMETYLWPAIARETAAVYRRVLDQ